MPRMLTAVQVNFGQGFQNLVNTAGRSIPKIGVLLLILIAGYIGGLLRPMQDRRKRVLSAAERETNSNLNASEQGRRDAVGAAHSAGVGAGSGSAGSGGPWSNSAGPVPGPNSHLGGGQTGPGGKEI